ncbi:MAG: Phosphoglycolate phosphatase (EC 3.1.3.18), partial [Olavius algarvensis Gamma 1 endosymbiont]
ASTRDDPHRRGRHPGGQRAGPGLLRRRHDGTARPPPLRGGRGTQLGRQRRRAPGAPGPDRTTGRRAGRGRFRAGPADFHRALSRKYLRTLPPLSGYPRRARLPAKRGVSPGLHHQQGGPVHRTPAPGPGGARLFRHRHQRRYPAPQKTRPPTPAARRGALRGKARHRPHGRGLGQRREGGAGRGLRHRLHELWLQPRHRHPHRRPGRRARFPDRDQGTAGAGVL